MAENSDVGEYSLKGLAEQVFGTKAIQPIKDNKRASYRDIWELSTPTTQCANTIGPSISKNTVCWLCGYAIDDSEIALKPECEHVLPVGQALIFLDLYKNTLHKGATNPELIKMLQLEYRWSHSVCNRIKSDKIFLSFNSKGTPVILTDVIKQYLGDIYKDGDIKNLVGKSSAKWVKERVGDISDQLQLIIDYMNKKTTGLLLLSGVASLYEPDNIAVNLRNVLSSRADEAVAKIATLSGGLTVDEFRTIQYFLMVKSTLMGQLSQAVDILTKTIVFAIRGGEYRVRVPGKDKETVIIKINKDKKFSLIGEINMKTDPNLKIPKRTYDEKEYTAIIKTYILNIYKRKLMDSFKEAIESNEFRGLFITYNEQINPFMIELITICILCLFGSELSLNPKLNGIPELKDLFSEDIEVIQSIWVGKCKQESYKLFFCRMTSLFIDFGVISPEIIKCVIEVECSASQKDLREIARLTYPGMATAPSNPKPVTSANVKAEKTMTMFEALLQVSDERLQANFSGGGLFSKIMSYFS
jgi:hypothetical protein